MSQSLSQVILHIVFSTKDRKNLIPSGHANELYNYIAKICHNHNSIPFEIGGIENHIHIACSLPRTISISDLLKEIKSSSSKWMHKQHDSFQWQTGYGVFSVSASHLDKLRSYIRNQKVHHNGISFKDELRALCDKYGADYDEAFLWD